MKVGRKKGVIIYDLINLVQRGERLTPTKVTPSKYLTRGVTIKTREAIKKKVSAYVDNIERNKDQIEQQFENRKNK